MGSKSRPPNMPPAILVPAGLAPLLCIVSGAVSFGYLRALVAAIKTIASGSVTLTTRHVRAFDFPRVRVLRRDVLHAHRAELPNARLNSVRNVICGAALRSHTAW